ncbi:MAG: hypothetical protein AAF458_14680 [Pseudomonadota bacterium]
MTGEHWLRLRQICLVAAEIEKPTEQLRQVFGLEVCYIDPNVGRFGLENRLLPIGNQLLEIVAPVEAGTAAERYLNRRGGDGGYMIITQCDSHPHRHTRVESLGVRVAHHLVHDDYRGMQLHPRDTGGTFFEIDQQLDDDAPDGNWHPAGPDWQSGRRTGIVDAILAAEVQSPDPLSLAERWGDIAELPIVATDDYFAMELENAEVRFTPLRDERGEGLSALHLRGVDGEAARDRALELGLVADDGVIEICGTRFHVS